MNNIFKKLLVACMCLTLAITCVACGGDKDGKPEVEDLADLSG